ncbi:YoaK family protein [Actinospica robiniae]|uniref:YoaK family protein n=1 Tax=Actinospica robiniae TaxID=304901 RepID=UPI0003F5388F|nr:YoaK family protein [Actinospica robiniae]
MSEVFLGAWHTVVPERGERHGPLAPLLLLLTLITGFVDAYSYLVLGHVFVANMTGNVVFCGFALAGTGGFSLPASVTALAAFAAGALIGGRVASERREHRGRLVHFALTIEMVLIAVAYAVAGSTHPATSAGSRYALICLLGLAMGVQNASARALAVPDLTTTVLTMTITGASADSRAAGGQGGKTGRRLLSVLTMFVGALIGALAVRHSHPSVSLLVALLLLLGASVFTSRQLDSREPWVKPVS